MENREIKFRGKRVDNGQWVYGYYVQWKHFNGKAFEFVGAIYIDGISILVDIKTVGQYTGFKDRNDKDIYEGDITKEGVVIFYLGAFCIKNSDSIILLGYKDNGYCDESWIEERKYFDFEVIGNKHENPEPL